MPKGTATLEGARPFETAGLDAAGAAKAVLNVRAATRAGVVKEYFMLASV